MGDEKDITETSEKRKALEERKNPKTFKKVLTNGAKSGIIKELQR